MMTIYGHSICGEITEDHIGETFIKRLGPEAS